MIENLTESPLPLSAPPVVFSAYPADKNSSRLRRSLMSWLRSRALRRALLIVPLVLMFVTYRYATGGVFLPASCQILGVGCPRLTVRGYVDPAFVSVRAAFEQNFANGDEIGSAVTVYYKGQRVVDLQGGFVDTTNKREYDEESLQLVFSSSKVMTSIVVARMVEQGLLDYNERIATYWPEFAQGNKGNVTLLDLMVHRAGVGWIDGDGHKMNVNDLHDLDSLAEILAAQPHNFDGKPTRSYHGVTRGWYVNEIVRRVDPRHRTVGQIFQEEIAVPHGIEFYYTLPEELEPRVAPIYEYPMLRVLAKLLLPNWMQSDPLHPIFGDMLGSNSPAFRSLILSSPNQTQPAAFNRREMHVVEGPSYSGITNARSMAKIAAIMANRGRPLVDDALPNEPSVMSEDTYSLATKALPEVFDVALHERVVPSVGGWGYFRLEGVEDIEMLGWGGSGGSIFIWNEELELGFAYCMNAFHLKLLGDRRSLRMLRETVDTINLLRAQS